ncbi:SoxS protein [Paracoccus zhejiangensis]|uniref:SoxS protein n=1 Tax=Paracoccus zhejiangensis TaxID=1077935 RepID=A0A2H5F2Y6_9RHOB|nr:SoxS protein [Paracoccus zhejiangensis]AUH65905.1 SoxS protein [Paracoccus zhejiangensis]
MAGRIGSWLAALVLALSGAAALAETAPDWQAAPVRLMMVDQQGCVYCAAWDAEIGPGFGRSAEGRTAPLLRVDIDGPWPDGIVLDRSPSMTPTFILLKRGVELGRVEGYVGDTYFYPVLAEMMREAGVPVRQDR